ncbi:FAD-binding protein, partial [Streptomyces sp. PRKS01-65]
MPTVVIAGGGIAGLACALALHGGGHRVLVLEPGPPPPPGPAAEAVARLRPRPTAPQVCHSHTLTSLGVRVLRRRAPQILAAARAAGAVLLDVLAALPDGATDAARRPGDEDLVALGCRRATLELLLNRAVLDLPGVTVRYGTAVRAVDLDPARRRVRAAVTRDGTRVPADIVIDATGRRALSGAWLRDAGVPVPADRTSPSGLTGHTRFYRLTTTARPGPLNRGNAAGDVFDHYAGVLHPADGGTFSVALATLPGDRALAALRTEAGFTAAARATPGIGAWLADGASVPISPVYAITSPPNTLRGTALPGPSPVAGLFPVGDAACTTDPLFGRGMSLALDHAFRVADVLADYPAVDLAQRRALARATRELFLPWYEHSAAADLARITRWRAAADGVPATPAARPHLLDRMAAAARADGVVWRALTRMLMSLDPPARALTPEVRARIRAAHRLGPRPPARPA